MSTYSKLADELLESFKRYNKKIYLAVLYAALERIQKELGK